MTLPDAMDLIYHIAERAGELSAEEKEALETLHDFIVNNFGDD